MNRNDIQFSPLSPLPLSLSPLFRYYTFVLLNTYLRSKLNAKHKKKTKFQVFLCIYNIITIIINFIYKKIAFIFVLLTTKKKVNLDFKFEN